MHLTKEDIQKMPKIERLNLINSVSGIKPANLIGTSDENKVSNLAIFSSVVHLGSNPALMGFVLRPGKEVRRHTYENILATKYYTINHVHSSFIEQAHYTAAKFEAGISEFEQCALTEEYLEGFPAPFVKESHLKLGLHYLQSIPIPLNDTTMVIGEIVHAIIPDAALHKNGHVDLSSIDVGISGLNSYYALQKIAQMPYARPSEVPEFKPLKG